MMTICCTQTWYSFPNPSYISYLLPKNREALRLRFGFAAKREQVINYICKPTKESRTIPECRRVFEIHMQRSVIARHVKDRNRFLIATAEHRAVTRGHCKPHKRRATGHVYV